MPGGLDQLSSPPIDEPGPFRFTEIAGPSGIDFVHVSGMTEKKYAPTANGSGVAMFDFDNDGKLDLYFACGTMLPLGSSQAGGNRLYKNLGNGRFRDMTAASGLGFTGYCHGINVGDIDNDGDQDVFLTNYGPNVLYLNQGDGTFKDISKSVGVDRSGWSSSAAFLDFDNDGDLDLYVARYGDWNLPEDDRFCGDAAKKVRLYCMPKEIRYAKHILYRNNGDLTFTDVTDAAGVGRTDGHAFAVVAADLNGDGRIDLYVANDQDPNFLFLNRGDGTFEDVTLTSGAAGDEHGQAQGGMGVDAEDVDGDGRPELVVTNFENEYNTFYQNLGGGLFLDATASYGLAVDSLPWVSWGCALADFDRDGWPDLFVANGHIDDNRELLGQASPYKEPAQIHWNRGGRKFRDVSRDAGPYFQARHVGHGAAIGDLDDDGDLDIVVNNKDAPPAVLRNDTPSNHRWIRFRLIGRRSNRDGIGASIEVKAGGRTIHRQRKGGTSVMSSHDPRILVGLGQVDKVQSVTVRWPSGSVSRIENPATNQTLDITESVSPRP